MEPEVFAGGAVGDEHAVSQPDVAIPGFDGRLVVLHGGGFGSRGPFRRAAEHRAGRLAARAALAELGVPALARARVGVGPHGEPTWPMGVVGSISHAAPWAVAAVSSRRELCGVGVDVETIHPHRAALADRVVMPEDARSAPSSVSTEQLATICFSLRESVYKCLNPMLGVEMEWDDVRLEIDWSSGAVAVCVDSSFGVRGALDAGIVALDGAVLTACWRTEPCERTGSYRVS